MCVDLRVTQIQYWVMCTLSMIWYLVPLVQFKLVSIQYNMRIFMSTLDRVGLCVVKSLAFDLRHHEARFSQAL